jgi:hypothetical protein
VLDHVQNQLKRVDELADTLGGQNGISICTTKLAAEAKVVESLKTAINTGGWYNQGAERGDYDNYQSPSTSELRPLEMAINDCARLSGGVNTEMGRFYQQLGTHLLRLRQTLVPAISSQDPDVWASVEEILEAVQISDDSKVTQNPNEFRKMLFTERFPEFTAARKEVEYQKKVFDVNFALEEAIPNFFQPDLEKYLAEAARLKMRPDFNPSMQEAKILLDRIITVRGKLSKAIASGDFVALSQGIDEAKGFRYETEEVIQARGLRDCLVTLHNAMTARSSEDLETGVKQAVEIKMMDNPVLLQARKMLSNIQGLRDEARRLMENVDAALMSSGTTDDHYAEMRQVQDAVEKLGTVSNAPELEKISYLIDRIQVENKVVDRLKKVIGKGGWTNRHVPKGEYERYQEGDSIKMRELTQLLAECKRLELRTEHGRTYFLVASNTSKLRTKVAAAVGGKDCKAWEQEEAILKADAIMDAPEEEEMNFGARRMKTMTRTSLCLISWWVSKRRNRLARR